MDNIKELLIRSLDSSLPEDEQTILNNALNDSLDLQQYKFEILEMRKSLKLLKDDISPQNFTNEVMVKLENEIPGSAGLVITMERTFKRISYIAAAALLILFGYNAYQSNEVNFDTLIGFEQPTMEQEFEDAIASID